MSPGSRFITDAQNVLKDMLPNYWYLMLRCGLSFLGNLSQTEVLSLWFCDGYKSNAITSKSHGLCPHGWKKGTTSKKSTNLPLSHRWGTMFIEYLAFSQYFHHFFYIFSTIFSSSFGETNHLFTRSKAESLVGRMASVPSNWWLLIPGKHTKRLRITIAALGKCSTNGGFSTFWVMGVPVSFCRVITPRDTLSWGHCW